MGLRPDAIAEDQTRRGAPLTWCLVVANVLLFAGQMAAERWHFFRVTHWLALSVAGMKAGYFWQLLTFQFLHGGWLHLFLNCWALFVFGREIEAHLGRARLLKLYLFSGIIGGLVQLLCGLLSPKLFGGSLVGASAGVFGLIAVFAALYPEEQVTLFLFFVLPLTLRAKTLFFSAVVVAIVGAVVQIDNVAHAAHLGGMLGGLVCLNLMRGVRWVPKPAVEERRGRT